MFYWTLKVVFIIIGALGRNPKSINIEIIQNPRKDNKKKNLQYDYKWLQYQQ